MRNVLFLLYLAALAVISGILFSKVSWVGKVGIRFFYSEYNFFKIWWQGALAVFGLLLLLFIVQAVVKRFAARNTGKAVQFTAVLLALLGLFLTYEDFRNDISHRWLGERFHIGAYLFWLGWISISIFHFVTAPDRRKVENRYVATEPKRDWQE